MSETILDSILPYTYIVGQEQLKLALELAYIAPRIGGVLVSGQRGTAKSTMARAFAAMMYDSLPVTIPINATEDRVVGGWQIDELMKGEAKEQMGLLEEADKKLLYIDEVNLLDDHIVNIILDVTSTGTLVIQREGRNEQKDVSFTLLGTMNPAEGGLRPQLLDRFGLMVEVETEKTPDRRRAILETVLRLDVALYQQRRGEPTPFFTEGRKETQRYAEIIELARRKFYDTRVPTQIAEACVALSDKFEVEGHRSDYLLALAARAYAARMNQQEARIEHLQKVAAFVLRHRRGGTDHLNGGKWDREEEHRLAELLSDDKYQVK